MPKFQIEITQTLTVCERAFVIIEADDIDAAEALVSENIENYDVEWDEYYSERTEGRDVGETHCPVHAAYELTAVKP